MSRALTSCAHYLHVEQPSHEVYETRSLSPWLFRTPRTLDAVPCGQFLRATISRRLYSIRLAGQFGDGLLQSALATFVLFSPEREPDAVRVAAAFAILLLPYSLIGPFAGVLLDRWQRRNVLVRANLLKSLFTVPIIVVRRRWAGGLRPRIVRADRARRQSVHPRWLVRVDAARGERS